MTLRTPSWEFFFRLGVLAVAVILVFQSLIKLRSVFLVVAASLVLALGVQPFLKYLEGKGMSRASATALMLSAGLVAASVVAVMVTPLLGDQIASIMEAGPGIIDDLKEGSPFLDTVLGGFDLDSLLKPDGEGATLASVFGGLFNLITVGVLTPYFAYAMPKMKVYTLRLMHREDREGFIRMFDEAVDRVSGFVSGNLIVSVLAAVTAFGALLLIGVPYPAALAIWIGVTDLVPVVGVFIGAIPALAVAYVELGTGGAIAVGVFIIVYQQIENYVVAPRVMKRTVDLSPPVVIVALMVGGSLAGVLGALLALPVAALVSLLANEFLIERRLDSVRDENNTGKPARIKPRKRQLP